MSIPKKDYIELNIFLKINGLAGTGGQAKVLIRSEAVKVNGETETRNKRKLRPGDIVEYQDKRLEVKSENIR